MKIVIKKPAYVDFSTVKISAKRVNYYIHAKKLPICIDYIGKDGKIIEQVFIMPFKSEKLVKKHYKSKIYTIKNKLIAKTFK